MSKEQQLIDFCKGFAPHTCTGRKTTAPNGAVSCECGSRTGPADPEPDGNATS